eukprot:m.110560 g.110560  ORF g.110560 m.110560 type:complete len:138 (-) comp22727_c0_seq5:553-966(-)
METPFVVALMAGGCAGITVDVCLFPLDTLKTRLQAEAGFRQAGGFRGIYRGLLATAAGSGPSAAAFFGTYETTRKYLNKAFPQHTHFNPMACASAGEAVRKLFPQERYQEIASKTSRHTTANSQWQQPSQRHRSCPL